MKRRSEKEIKNKNKKLRKSTIIVKTKAVTKQC
jgi:hypothetical protein